MAITWLFFDIGDVLFDEDAQHNYLFHTTLLAMRRHGITVSWDDYRFRLRQRSRSKPGTAIVDAARDFVPDAALWDTIYTASRAEYEEMRKPRPYGMLRDNFEGVLKDLHSDFKLGILANQHPPVMDGLRDYGVDRYFDIIGIDQIVGLSKPDTAFFRWALDKAGIEPHEAIMIGDRPDNDIAPANGVGMATIRYRVGTLYSHYDPQTPDEHADIEVKEISGLAHAVRQVARSHA